MSSATGSPSRFGLLASAVAGRTVLVTTTATDRAWTDGTTIYLPEQADAAQAAAAVLAQATLLHGGSLATPAARRAARGPADIAGRYLVLEVARTSAEHRGVLPGSHLAAVGAVCPDPEQTAADSLRRATDRAHGVASPPPWFGRLSVAADTATDAGTAPLCGDEAALGRDDAFRELSEDEQLDADRSRILELLSAPAMRNPLTAALQRMLGMGRSRGGGTPGDDLAVGGHRAAPVGASARPVTAPSRLRSLFGPTEPVGLRYPEWDGTRGRYRQQWCAVAELDPAPGTAAGRAMPDAVPANRALQRELARIGLRRRPQRRLIDGDDVDLDALVELRIERAAGAVPDGRVFQARLPTGRDLAVLVLLDSTGSSAEESDTGTAFADHRRIAADLTAALAAVGDRVATYGFYSRGRHSVRMLRVKTFDDPFDHAARQRLSDLTPVGFTRLGAAIRHATHLLASHAGATNQVLVVISDGFAYDDGYEDSYARADARRALAEAGLRGIGCVGLRISSGSAVAEFADVWSQWPARQLDQPADLTRHIRPAITDALRRAQRPHRTWNREAAR